MSKSNEIEFYQRENGQIPVLDFFSLSPKLRAKALRYMEDYKRRNQDE